MPSIVILRGTKSTIKTEEAYTLALNQVEKLMDAKPGTEEFDMLELLSTLIESYEDKHYQINMPTPVAAIKFRMEQQGLKPPESLCLLLCSISAASETGDFSTLPPLARGTNKCRMKKSQPKHTHRPPTENT